jgi:hypothetical protein
MEQPTFSGVQVALYPVPTEQSALLWAQRRHTLLTITYPATQTTSHCELYMLLAIRALVQGTHTVSVVALHAVPTVNETAHDEHGKQVLSDVPPHPPE